MRRLLEDAQAVRRCLAGSAGFAALVVATMAVGIGANVGVFAYLSYFLRPTLVAPAPGELVWVYNEVAGDVFGATSHLDYRDLEKGTRDVFRQLVGQRIFAVSLQSDERTLHSFCTAVSGGYFALFGARPVLGRLIGPADDRAGAPRVVVLSHLTWTRHFGADPAVLGETLLLDGRTGYEVVGVAPPSHQGTGIWTGIYVPLATAQPIVAGLDRRDSRRTIVVGRLQPGVGQAEAAARLAAVAASLDEAHPEPERRRPRLQAVTTPQDGQWGDQPIVEAAKILMAAVAMLLLLACANVASLFVARSLTRRQELAVQLALGASHWRLVRRLLLESLTLCAAGGALGLGLSRGVLRLIESYLRREVPVGMGDWGAGTLLSVRGDELALFFTALTLLAALLCALTPVFQTMRSEAATILRGDWASRRSGGGLGGRDLLVVVQLSLSTVLLVGALLLGRTLVGLDRAPLGFAPDGLTLATVFVPPQRLQDDPADDGAGLGLQLDLLRRTRDLAGVAGACLSWRVPLQFRFSQRIRWPHSGEEDQVALNVVSDRYFATLGVPLTAGRDFDERDSATAPRVAIVNRAAAERYFPGESPLGRRLEVVQPGEEEGGGFEIVGVAGDYRFEPPPADVAPRVYLMAAQNPRARMTLLVRSPGIVGPSLRALLRDRYPDLAIVDLLPFSAQEERALAHPRMSTELSGGVALLGLLLAAFGLFSVASVEIRQRRREIGIRRAIGADRGDVLRWLASRVGRRLLFGVGSGILIALASGRVLEALLVGVRPIDPLSFGGAIALLGAAAIVATWLPARRALRVAPAEVMR